MFISNTLINSIGIGVSIGINDTEVLIEINYIKIAKTSALTGMADLFFNSSEIDTLQLCRLSENSFFVIAYLSGR